jgi:hypothetical protein
MADGDTRVARVQREFERFATRPPGADGGAEVVEKLLVSRLGVRDTRDATD